jgi:hypothetical protein
MSGGPRLRRIAILGSLLMLVVTASVWTIGCLVAALSLSNEIESQSALLNAMQDRLQAVGARLPGDSQRAVPGQDAFLPGETADVAAAALQRLVTEKIRQAGGDVIESGREGSGTEAKEPDSVYLRVAFAGDIGKLQRVLFELEGGKPALLVRQLALEKAVSAPDDPQKSPELKAVMLVGAQWKDTR